MEPDGRVAENALRPDNKALPPMVLKPTDKEVHVVAEYLETVG